MNLDLVSIGNGTGSRETDRLAIDLIKRLQAAGAAKKLAGSIASDRFGSEAARLRPVATELAWIAPNDTWSPNRPDAPAPKLRLAWLVRFEARGPLAERVRLVEYWLDAGSGELIGGDLAE